MTTRAPYATAPTDHAERSARPRDARVITDFEAGDRLHLAIPYRRGTPPPQVSFHANDAGDLLVIVDGAVMTILSGGAMIDLESEVIVDLVATRS
ncbi:hypothetical protein [Pararhodobacter marinus]|uniref:Uncharacterized protein n=1 Tax=Pararhodobacter marinus TaxID=2184063 RepID=A0A2U2C8V8_9RHOB|nr:hypothetical protein [Pararhodobacter marinus]PWE28315.1 hypothetical protein C4N9_13340 [Pararhodobacter marinus]